jgi:predicted transcriptional regulator
MSEVVTYNYIIRMNKDELLANREAVNNYLKSKIFAIKNISKTREENKRLINDIISFLVSKGIDLNSYLEKEVLEWLARKK